ncbi:MAG: threonine synthase [Flavobacteriaceae bacterium]|nr:threonine synthase [Flavobacteriaceae bacterium]
MKFFSLNNNTPPVNFEKAVRMGLAPDRGLFFPETIKPLPDTFWDGFLQMSKEDIAFEVISQFIGDEIPELDLKQIIKETLCFDFPLVHLNDNVSTLELFQGPTMAFKDVGGRFMARCLGHFNKNNDEKVTVLVATSGDTGGAVASGFDGIQGIEVIILYPKGKVSAIQELQLTTQGKNITALEVEGTFDDCQEMVKTAFLDPSLKQYRNLTSANSINVARWLPQSFYYFFAVQDLMKKRTSVPYVFSVPSGNFGNICAGLVAHKMGLPIAHFIASTNNNDTFPRYMEAGVFSPKPSVQTISNAMDVGNPSNFERIQKLFNYDLFKLKTICSAYAFSDKETRSAMTEVYKDLNYITDPHGAVGYLGLKEYMKSHPGVQGVFLETAHPVKFLDIVEQTLKQKIEIPKQIQDIMDKKSTKKPVKSYEGLKAILVES